MQFPHESTLVHQPHTINHLVLILAIKVLGLVRHLALGHHKRQQVPAGAGLEDLGVLVDGGVDAHADGAPHHLGNLALVDRSQAGLLGVLYPAEGGDVVGDEGEVLQPPAPVCQHCVSEEGSERVKTKDIHDSYPTG